MSISGHIPVLMDQVLERLSPGPGMVMLDCTVGRGGHSGVCVGGLAPGGRLIGLDVDPGNIAYSRSVLEKSPVRVDLIRANFVSARGVLDKLGVDRVDLLLADLGFASAQMEDSARGFSFRVEGPLDMRLDPGLPRTAADLVNRLGERELADVIYRYGEERLSRRIARNIVVRRKETPILTTTDLAEIVRRSYGRRGGSSRIDPATRTFMALRIAVNAEIESLEGLLRSLPGMMNEGGRAAVISFHSLEDRLVKQAFMGFEQGGLGQRLTRKPVIAEESEVAGNPRSRSAKMRVFQFGTWSERD